MLRHDNLSARDAYKTKQFHYFMKTYKYRLYPSKQQIKLLNKTLDLCRYLYNTQLRYEKYVYVKDIRFANKIELNNLLPDLKIINKSISTLSL